MRYLLSLVLFIIAFNIPHAYSYKNKRAVLVLSKDAQVDSIGHNLVTGLSGWIYDKIKSGTLTLYESPLKEREISYTTLVGLENSSKTKFSETSYLFIYELWSSYKNETSFEILGFRFMNENKGNEIDYGYIDFPDIENAVKKAYIKSNINGSYKTSFYQVLMNKEYDYDLLFFDNQPIQKINSKDPVADYHRGKQIIEDAFGKNKENLNYVVPRHIKLIEYLIISNNVVYDEKADNLITAIEEYFNENRRDLYSYGGSEIYKYFKKSNIIISKCYVKELWIKEDNVIKYKTIEIFPHSLGMPFEKKIEFTNKYKPVASKITVKGESLQKAIEKKDFSYRIIKINGIKIDPDKHKVYLKALRETEWYNITAFVRDNYRLKNY